MKLSQTQKIRYFIDNWWNNRSPLQELDKTLTMRNFVCADLGSYWSKLNKSSSPSRKLCDLFLMTLPWQKLSTELGGIRLVDVGCGSGNYSLRLLEWSNKTLQSYTGIDIKKDASWEKLSRDNPRFKFMQSDSRDIATHINTRSNFFLACSSLEHFEEDITYFARIKEYVLRQKKPAILISIFPSKACLMLYLAHGIRQYTPRTISKISTLFKDTGYSVLFALGGQESIRLHRNFITIPLLRKIGDLREKKPEEYDQKSFTAIKKDMRTPSRTPVFYALVTHCFGTEKFF